jgi:hypothetical protein
MLVCLAAACGGSSSGGGSMPSQPQPDFTLSVTPSETYAVVGNTTAPVGISVAPQNGFSGTVTITLQGLPSGVGVSPSPPFQLAAAATQFVVLAVPTSATLGMSSVAVVATVGALSHRAQLTLTTHPQPSVRTYQDGSVLYLESSSGGDTARIGLETNWGGSVVELSHDGTNFVNAHDTGREVQPAFREVLFGPIAVGTPVAGRPPHRSRRARFAHRAPTSGV